MRAETLVGTFGLGVTSLTAGIIGSVSAFSGMFQHGHVRTPRGLRDVNCA